MAAVRRWQILIGLLAASACSGSLVGSDYRGVPLFTVFGGTVTKTGEMPPDIAIGQTGRLGLFWSPQGTAGTFAIDKLVEQPSNDGEIVLLGSLMWSLYDPPPPEVVVRTQGGRQYTLGFFFVYDDANGNGRWDAAEKVLSFSDLNALLYAPEDIPASDAPIGREIPAGYRLTQFPIQCSPARPLPSPPGAPACDVPLGAACSADADCGTGGSCLTTDPFPWVGGYCSIAFPPSMTCTPANAAVLHSPGMPGMMGMSGTPSQWFVEACTSDADCTRGMPYQCDLSIGACLPSNLLTLTFSGPSQLPICVNLPAM